MKRNNKFDELSNDYLTSDTFKEVAYLSLFVIILIIVSMLLEK